MINKKRANELSGREWLMRSFSVWRDLDKSPEERQLKHPAMFPVALASKLIECFASDSNGLVLDPFAGSGSTLIAALDKGMPAVGMDINSEYRNLFENRLKENLFPNKRYEYIISDSRHSIANNLQENSVEICITSPPYWDILHRHRTADKKENIVYSKDPVDLGNTAEYDSFIHGFGMVTKGVYRALRHKGYFIVNVMDIRKKSIFYPLHMDVIPVARNVGFSLEDIIIWDRQNEYNNMRPLGYPHKFIINKVHEYLLVFRKDARS